MTGGSFQKAGLPRWQQVLFCVGNLPCSRALGRPKPLKPGKPAQILAAARNLFPSAGV